MLPTTIQYLILEIMAKHGKSVYASILSKELSEHGVSHNTMTFDHWMMGLEDLSLVHGFDVNYLIESGRVFRRVYRLTPDGLDVAQGIIDSEKSRNTPEQIAKMSAGPELDEFICSLWRDSLLTCRPGESPTIFPGNHLIDKLVKAVNAKPSTNWVDAMEIAQMFLERWRFSCRERFYRNIQDQLSKGQFARYAWPGVFGLLVLLGPASFVRALVITEIERLANG